MHTRKALSTLLLSGSLVLATPVVSFAATSRTRHHYHSHSTSSGGSSGWSIFIGIAVVALVLVVYAVKKSNRSS
ncbi:hypothetical protein [Streptomyces beijiangensis]|uniref:Secreted protein n=1 Tax=Streptomyces beijiangensis TaxID=163361 RepID=A0A939JJW7_9ACTN|nr:hypothetical protein [Streptomyces beijiangensis]MBO0514069.1 hypothetical protein [Streptomyces beijiangensis]